MQKHEKTPPAKLWHKLTFEQVLLELDTTVSGLNQLQVKQRQQLYGANNLPEPPRRSAIYRFFAQCHNVLIYVLLASALVTILLQHWVDSAVILGVVFINAFIGMLQEGKAESAILALRSLLSNQASVVRGGRRQQVVAEELVPGDIVRLQAGDKVPADLRLINVKNFHVQEAVLTGESLPIEKNIQPLVEATLLADQSCMAFSGTLVTYGQASGVVVATSTMTEIGCISTLLSEVNKLTTPLLRQLTLFGHQLTSLIIAVAIFTLIYGVWVYDFAWSDMFLAAVGQAVAAIPEGLPAIMTITLAIGVQKMAVKNAIIRRLPAVETLGSVTVICSDKTGTLTRNEMTVTHVISAVESKFEITGQGYDPHGAFLQQGRHVNPEAISPLLDICRAVLLCNDAHLQFDSTSWQLSGDPTEGALLTLAMKAGLSPEQERLRWPRLDSIPFESQYQFMASLNHDHQGHHICFVKGAPEKILQMCREQLSQSGQQILDVAHWQAQLALLAEQGLRVLAVASKTFSSEKVDLVFDDVQSELTFLGLIAMMDPPRQEAIKAVEQCHSAGIEVKMITGDHLSTAISVAKMMGLTDGQRVLDGRQLEKMDEADLREAVQQAHVFARTSPTDKLRLVEALQANGHIVAMTGDGVNDAPALKRADVGAAMGINGSEVAKDTADMVLADDNFASIVDAVYEGRTVYDNLKKALLFILPTSAGEAMVITAAIFLGMTLPITPVQILWVNMITAVTLGLALAFEPGEPDLMSRKPRRADEPLLSKALIWRIVFVSFVLMIGSFGLFLWAMAHGEKIEYARTVAVNTLVMFEIFYLFNARYLTASVIKLKGLIGNHYVLLAVVVLLLFQLAFTYLPFMQFLFASTALSLASWIEIVLVASTVFWLVELEKWFIRQGQKQKSRAT